MSIQPPLQHSRAVLRSRLLKWRCGRNFFPEPVLPQASSQKLPLGYAGNGSIRSWAVFKEDCIWASIDFHIFETGTPIHTARCCTRLAEFHDSTSSVPLTMPGNFIRSPPCREQDGMEVHSSTTLLSHSPSCLTRRQNGFRVRRRQDYQLRLLVC